jgi:hypothetical protein
VAGEPAPVTPKSDPPTKGERWHAVHAPATDRQAAVRLGLRHAAQGKARVKGGYSAVAANGLLADYANIREGLAHRLNALDLALDLASAVRPTETGIRRRLARFIVEGHRLPINPQTRELPDPDLLKDKAVELRAQGLAKESHQMSRVARDVRLMIMLAGRMIRSQASPRKARSQRHVLVRFSLVAALQTADSPDQIGGLGH